MTSLWVGGLTPQVTQADLRDKFYGYGEIGEVQLLRLEPQPQPPTPTLTLTPTPTLVPTLTLTLNRSR